MITNELRNTLSREEGLKKLKAEKFKRTTLSFYRYVNIEDPQRLRDELWKEWTSLRVLGRVYLAKEGINAQISLPSCNLDTFRTLLDSHPEFKDVPFKVALEEGDSFWKLTIKVRKQIVADGLEHGEYDISNVGNHLTAKEWNEAMNSEDTVVVDMRNHYESEVGHFENAVTPDVDTFKEELRYVDKALEDKKDKKILLYCTGGIRCEKASAYLKHKGFKDVNQMHGGIIQYAHDIKKDKLDNKFKGKNFVFDNRLAEKISDDVISKCHQCGDTCDRHVNCKNEMCNLLFIQCKSCEEKTLGTCTTECQEYVKLPEEEKYKLRKQQKVRTRETYRERIRPKLKIKTS